MPTEPIQHYEVTGLGTVEAHGDAGNVYHLRAFATPNQINAYRAPAGQLCDPARAAADIAEAITNPPIILATPADIAAHRYEIETGGILYTLPNGGGIHRFDTTRENRVMWLAMQGLATAHPGLTQSWKTLEGDFVTLTATDILAIVAAIFAHIAACFAGEAALLANPPALADLPAAFAALAP